jgi:hypothetical protein
LNTLIRNRELNRLELEIPSGKNIVSPYYPNYSFPLDVGKTWEQKTTFTRNYENRKAVATLQGKVIGWEQVTVPAGTFRALKIELGGFYNGSNSSSNWSGQIFHTIWYVPEVKNFVKEIYRDTYRGVTSNHDIHELVEYKLSQ